MMKYKRILVVYKKPLLNIYRKKSKKIEELLKEGWAIEDLEAEKKEFEITKKIVKPILESDKTIKVDWKYRANLSKELINKYDLIMPFGGDGTLIETSHYILDKPVLGVNSDYRPDDPQSSEGFLLSANKHNFKEKYKKLQKGSLMEYPFNRLQVELNGEKLEELVLNDILVAHENPASTSRMIVKDHEIEEFQKNDGLIIATAASNWAISYGGMILPLTCREISYVTRGFYLGRLNPIPELKRGITYNLEVCSKMREGKIFVDGRHIEHHFGLGAELKVYPSKLPLTILGFEEEKRKYYTRKV